MPRSGLEKLWLTVGGIAALVLLLVGWFFFIGPQRSKTSDVRGQISSAQLQYSTLQSKIAALRAQSADIGKYKAELAAARKALPSTDGVPAFLRTLQALGNATMTDVSTITVGAPAAEVSPATPTPDTADTASTSPSPTDSATTSTTAPSTGVYSMAITAQVSGSASALGKFLDQLQSVQPRAVLITQVTESAGGSAGGGKGTSLQLSMQAFVDPTTTAAATPAPMPTG